MTTPETRHSNAIGLRNHLRRRHLLVVLWVTVAVVVVLLASAATTLQLERDASGSKIRGLPDALWWAMETISTVGYGDIHPVTTGGRVVAVVLMVLGIGLIGIITATVVAWVFTEIGLVGQVEEIEEATEAERVTLSAVLDELERINRRLDQLER